MRWGDDLAPPLVREVLHRLRGRAHAGVVEEHVEPAPLLLHLREERGDRFRIADIGRHGDRAVRRSRIADGFLERLEAAARERDVVAILHERERGGLADARARAVTTANFTLPCALSLRPERGDYVTRLTSLPDHR